MTNETRNILIGAVVLALVAGAYYFGTTSKDQTGLTNNTQDTDTLAPTQETAPQPVQVQQPVKQTTPKATTNNETKKVATVEELQACSQQAKINFNNIVSSETKNQADLREIRTYTNHLNTKDGKCYMVITGISNDIGSKMKRLYDVYDNKKLAFDWIQTNPSTGQSSDLCLITGGGDCLINKIFEERMESASY